MKYEKLKKSFKGLLKLAKGYLSVLLEPFKEIELFNKISLKEIAMAFQGKSAKEIELYSIEKRIEKEEMVRAKIRREFKEKYMKEQE